MTKRSDRSSAADFPLATIARYGPDNTRAIKVVVSILRGAEDRDPSAMRTWTTDAGDIRADASVSAEVAAFIAAHGVKQTVEPDRIIGCPHQEGIDYPMGRQCPHCPFWAGIDRFTHEPIRVAAPSMSADDVLRMLADDPSAGFEEALASADAHRDVLVDRLLDALEQGIADPAGASNQAASLFSYSLYLLAKWREPRAYPYVIRWLSLPEEVPFDIGGDIVTMDGARILAGVCDGNVEPITSLILNRRADQWGRSAGVGALARLAAWAELPRAQVIERLLCLAREGLEREPSHVWESFAAECSDLEAVEVFPELRRAYDEGFIDPLYISQSELDEVEASPRGRTVQKMRERYPPIDDVAAATAWWDRRAPDSDDDDEELLGDSDDNDEELLGEDDDWEDGTDEYIPVAEPYRAPPKVGRNEPCPCGSGKKYKKCCGR